MHILCFLQNTKFVVFYICQGPVSVPNFICYINVNPHTCKIHTHSVLYFQILQILQKIKHPQIKSSLHYLPIWHSFVIFVIEKIWTSFQLLFIFSLFQTLLPAANILQMTEVRDACCEFLQSQLHPSNCIGIKAFADLHACTDLLNYAQTYTEQHFVYVSVSRSPQIYF